VLRKQILERKKSNKLLSVKDYMTLTPLNLLLSPAKEGMREKDRDIT